MNTASVRLAGSRRLTILAALLVIGAIAGPRSVAAEEEGSPVEVHGFFLANYAARVTGLRPTLPSGAEAGDYPLAEERLRIELFAADESIDASATIKGDLYHDDVAGVFDLDLREAFIDYTWEAFDFRLGRQIVTWGVGDLLFVNDLTPKNWVSFFAGRPLEYLKVGVDGFRVRFSSEPVNIEALAIPIFEPDTLPSADRFFYYDPMAAVTNRTERRPQARIDNAELALRIYRQVGNFDLALYAYRGFWRSPAAIPDSLVAPTQITFVYPKLSVYGASATGSALGGVLSLEAGYYHSRDDLGGRNPLIPNGQARFLIGFSKQAWEDGTIGVQYYGEFMQNYIHYRQNLPPGFPRAFEYRDVVTLRVEQYLKSQTWRLSLMVFYSPADDDYLVQPYTSYKLSDNLAIAAGANVFGGRNAWTMFGQFGRNDNVYTSLRYDLW